MIKCPECGRQISDKAPVCPNCGVEIAGKITLCPQCGEAYFSDQESCPNCHHLTHGADSVNKTVSNQEPERQNVSPRSTPPVPPQSPSMNESGAKTVPHTPPVPPENNATAEPAQKPEKRRTPLIVGFIFALIVCAIGFYFYNDAKSSNEEQRSAGSANLS